MRERERDIKLSRDPPEQASPEEVGLRGRLRMGEAVGPANEEAHEE